MQAHCEMNKMSEKIANAAKWSTITEIVSKIVPPITNMILARIIAPEDFGIMATITLIMSFAEVFVESGFQKFLIQHEFVSDKQEHDYMSVAFWSNLVFSIIIWLFIVVFNTPIASLAGNPGKGHLISITGITIPLFGVIGIQNCKIRKNLDFKKLFYVRFVSSLLPLFITVPLAFCGLGYWALIIGNISGVLVRSITLYIVGKFVPRIFFSKKYLMNMLRFGVWTLLDGVAVWATAWIDSLLIANYMSNYYLGLYKNSCSTINSLFSIITASMIPVLFAALSRLQSDDKQFNNTFLSTQRVLSIILLPMGVGIYFYRNLVTDILFGAAWEEAANIVGAMSLSTVIRTLFVSIYSEVYRAKGKFHIPLLTQILDLFFLIPACVISVRHGFWALVYTRALIKLDLIIPEFILIYKICGIAPMTTLKNISHTVVATFIMSLLILLLKNISNSIGWSLISIAFCVIIYFGVLCLYSYERTYILNFIENFSRKLHKPNNNSNLQRSDDK